MKTFQMDNRPEILEFTNYDRVDEVELFNIVMEELKANPDVIIGEKESGPLEDFYNCTIEGEDFILHYDIDYGPSIYSKSVLAIEKLIKYFG